jgi:hypothetical protein
MKVHKQIRTAQESGLIPQSRAWPRRCNGLGRGASTPDMPTRPPSERNGESPGAASAGSGPSAGTPTTGMLFARPAVLAVPVTSARPRSSDDAPSEASEDRFVHPKLVIGCRFSPTRSLGEIADARC